MNVLMIVGNWPTRTHAGHIFVKRQVDSLQALGIECDVWNLAEQAHGWRKYLKGIFQVRKRIRQQHYDLIHAHYGYCGWVARNQSHTPVVISFMGDDLLGTPDASGHTLLSSRLIVYINRLLAHRVDAVIVKSPELAQAIAPVKSYLVPNGVDLHLFSPITLYQARSGLGWHEEKYYVLFPNCPNIPVKGFPLAKAVIEKIKPDLDKPVELIPLCGVEPERVPLYMNACDALLMTSLHEGSPNVVKESMACNLPVISVPVGDVPILLDGVENSQVYPRDMNALAEDLIKTLMRGQRSNGRAIIERKGLDLESVAKKIISVYKDILVKG